MIYGFCVWCISLMGPPANLPIGQCQSTMHNSRGIGTSLCIGAPLKTSPTTHNAVHMTKLAACFWHSVTQQFQGAAKASEDRSKWAGVFHTDHSPADFSSHKLSLAHKWHWPALDHSVSKTQSFSSIVTTTAQLMTCEWGSHTHL